MKKIDASDAVKAGRHPADGKLVPIVIDQRDPRSDDGEGDEGRTTATVAPAEDWIVTVAAVEREFVKWLWCGRLARGKLAVLDGDPGLGKSTLTLDLAARISRGDVMPDGSPLEAPGDVLLMTAEDGIGDTIRPRLEAAGANLDRVHVLKGFPDGDGGIRPPSIPEDCARIAEIVRARGIVLVVVDPLMAFLGGAVDAHADKDVRRALHPLARMGEETGAAILVVRHLNKAGGLNPLYRGGGSIGIIGAARSGLLVARDREDPDGGRRVLAVTKSNLAKEPPGLTYEIESCGDVGRVRWLGETDQTATSLISLDMVKDEHSSTAEASTLLRELLVEAGGELPAKKVQKILADAGFPQKTAQRARQRVGAEAVRQHFSGAYIWRLPDPPIGATLSSCPAWENGEESTSSLHGGQPAGQPVQHDGSMLDNLHAGQPSPSMLDKGCPPWSDDVETLSLSHGGQLDRPHDRGGHAAGAGDHAGQRPWAVKPPRVGARRAAVTHRIAIDNPAVGPELREVFERHLAAEHARLNAMCARALEATNAA